MPSLLPMLSLTLLAHLVHFSFPTVVSSGHFHPSIRTWCRLVSDYAVRKQSSMLLLTSVLLLTTLTLQRVNSLHDLITRARLGFQVQWSSTPGFHVFREHRHGNFNRLLGDLQEKCHVSSHEAPWWHHSSSAWTRSLLVRADPSSLSCHMCLWTLVYKHQVPCGVSESVLCKRRESGNATSQRLSLFDISNALSVRGGILSLDEDVRQRLSVVSLLDDHRFPQSIGVLCPNSGPWRTGSHWHRGQSWTKTFFQRRRWKNISGVTRSVSQWYLTDTLSVPSGSVHCTWKISSKIALSVHVEHADWFHALSREESVSGSR